MCKTWKLEGPDGKPYASAVPGTLSWAPPQPHYGRLDCPAALRAILRGGYITYRVFFLDAQAARAAGYRPVPCACQVTTRAGGPSLEGRESQGGERATSVGWQYTTLANRQ